MPQNKKITQAVILAGGKGERLRSFTDTNPKPMVPTNDKPFLEYLIELLKENSIEEVVILTGYLGEKISEYFSDGSKFGIRIKYSFTPFLDENGNENESGLRIKNAEPLLNDFFLLMYCDNYWPLNLEKLVEFYGKQNTLALVTVYANKDGITKNNVFVDENGYVAKYNRTRTERNLNGVEIGFFILNKKVLELLPVSNSHFEKTVLPILISQKQLSGFLSDHRYYSIGSLDRLKTTEEFLRPKKVILLDRDGVINKKPPKADYVKNWGEFEFLPGAIEAIKLLNGNGYQVYVISNQPGIVRGKMTLDDLEDIHKNLRLELEKRGAKIDGIYVCLHNWEEGCECRKPKPGLLFQAARENKFDLTKAIFIGDDERDLVAGGVADCKTILINSADGLFKVVKSLIKN